MQSYARANVSILENQKKHHNHPTLVGGFNPFETYISQIGSFPQIGVKMKKMWVATT